MEKSLNGKKLLSLTKGLAGFTGILLVLFVIFSCNNILITSGGSLIISTPGARAASDSISYTIVVEGSKGSPQSKTLTSGSSVQFDNLAPDTYTISVEGRKEGDVLVYSGTKSATVTAGETSSVMVELQKLLGSLTVDFSGTGTSSATEFKVELNIGDTPFKSEPLTSGTTVQFDDLAPGAYNIVVEGMDASGAVVLYGTRSATVEAGATASATVNLGTVANDLNSLQQAVTAGGIVYIGSAINVDSTLTVNTDVTLLPAYKNVTLTNTTANNSHLIHVTAGELTVSGDDNYTITLDGNKKSSTSATGIIRVEGACKLYLNQNSIVTNNGSYGVYVTGENAVNKAYVELNGGIIKDNLSSGICLSQTEFVMNSGSIENNTCDSRSGAAVSMSTSNTSFVMKGGTITGNTVTGTTPTNGGAINVTGGSSFTMEGGIIINNTTTGKGKGVYFAGSGSLKIGGSAVIDTSNDVYFSSSYKLSIISTLTGATTVATITPETYSAGTQVLQAENGVDLAAMVKKFNVTPNPDDDTQWTIDTAGKLQQVQ